MGKRTSAVTGRLSRACASVALASVFVASGAEMTQTAVANGDTRTLSFYHTHSKEKLTVTFKKDGRYDPEALKKLNYFLRDWRNQKQTTMEPRLFDVVWEVTKDAGSTAPIQIISSYRSPETNEGLRSRSSGVAKNSQHMLGKAMDIHLPDVDMAKIRVAGLRLQRGGVGFYPTSALPFVHLDVGSVRHWPRMTRDQLVKVFPDGRTVHIPTDGKPLQNYALAMADVRRNGATLKGDAPAPRTMVASAKGGRGFLAKMIGGDDEDDTPAPAITAPAARTAAPAETAPATPAPAPASSAVAAIAAAVPLPVARPDEVAPAGPQLAAAYAPQPQLASAGPEMVWRAGPDATAGRASASYEAPATTPSAVAEVQMPMPRPTGTTPSALVAQAEPAKKVLTPAAGAVVTASLAPGLSLSDERNMALRMLNAIDQTATVQPAKPPVPDAIGHIIAAHDAFAPRAAAPVAQTAALQTVPPASLSGQRTARDRSLPMTHPNLQRVALTAPADVLPINFGGNPNSGMRSDAFVGAAVVTIRTMSFGPQRTAELVARPRG